MENGSASGASVYLGHILVFTYIKQSTMLSMFSNIFWELFLDFCVVAYDLSFVFSDFRGLEVVFPSPTSTYLEAH